jgi:hypothetical protein
MFLDFSNQVPPAPWEPNPAPPARPPLTPRQRKTVEMIVGFNLVMMLFAPLAGATIFEGIVALLR